MTPHASPPSHGRAPSRGGEGRPGALRVLELFAGVGGFGLGLERTGGFKTIAVAEVDDYASRILHMRFPDAPNLGDVTQAEYPDAEVICAGFPCQDISFAGAGAGLAGTRSGLFWEVVRAIRVVRPEHVILENVAALLSRGLDTVVWALAEIGYDAEWHCIPASAVGAHHRRDRIWIIAHPRGEQHEGCRAPISGEIAAELLGATAHPESLGRGEGEPVARGGDERAAPRQEFGPRNVCSDLANATSVGLSGPRQPVEPINPAPHRDGQAGEPVDGCLGDFWAIEPSVGRVAHGIPKRVDRLRCLGNAVVPQIPELIGRAILEARAA